MCVQGLIAGVNAARRAQGLALVQLPRHSSYIGTLLDDLVTKVALPTATVPAYPSLNTLKAAQTCVNSCHVNRLAWNHHSAGLAWLYGGKHVQALCWGTAGAEGAVQDADVALRVPAPAAGGQRRPEIDSHWPRVGPGGRAPLAAVLGQTGAAFSLNAAPLDTRLPCVLEYI